jgi:hypothetical protein
MLEADVLYEYRQIQAFEYEKKHGKSMPQETQYDDSYEQWQEEMGLTKEAIAQAKGHGG